MTLQSKIKQLSEIRSKEVPVISLYLHYSHREAREIDKIRIFIKNFQKEIEKRGFGKELAGDIKAVQEYLENNVKPTTHGIAFFYCSAIGLKTEIQTWAPVRDQWTLSGAPNLRQLARIVDDYENTLAVVVNSEKGRILHITPEAMVEEMVVTDDFPGRHDQGGWSQGRYQRHIEEHLHRHLKSVSEAVSKTWDANNFTNFVLAGQDRIVPQFVKLLPKRIAERQVGLLHRDVNDDLDDIVTEVVHLIREVEEKRAMEELSSLRSTGSLVEGWEGLIPAINQSRVATLYLKVGDSRPGWLCPTCDVLGEKVPLGCPICGGDVTTSDLVDAAVTKIEKDGGRVEVCMSLEDLDIAGRVRF